jgi:putative restriction endonuclease
MTADEFLAAIESLNVWRSGGQRAPHKPLLLLYALARFQSGQTRISYKEVDDDLRRLLIEFGPARKSVHPEYPFWRLQNDGLWVVSSHAPMKTRLGNTDARKSELIEQHAEGQFTADVVALLRSHPQLAQTAAQRLLDGHFAESLHQDIADAVGLDLAFATTLRRKRDREFRQRVLRAYGYRCAICGFDVRLDMVSIGLEAAHIMWHQAGGPDDETNGLALCTMHHKLLDFGAYRLSEDHRLFVSDRVNGSSGVEEWLLRFDGRSIRQPNSASYQLNPQFVTWHVREVFKGVAT